jgi:hypothetical protein
LDKIKKTLKRIEMFFFFLTLKLTDYKLQQRSKTKTKQNLHEDATQLCFGFLTTCIYTIYRPQANNKHNESTQLQTNTYYMHETNKQTSKQIAKQKSKFNELRQQRATPCYRC